MTRVTEQQLAQFVAALEAELAPAKLHLEGLAGDRNGHLLNGELGKRGLPNTIPNIVFVIKEILFQDKLEWLVEPKKLQAHKALVKANGHSSTKIENPRELEAKRQEAVKASEAASALAKKNDKFENLTRVLIGSYAPRDKRGNPAYRKQSEEQTRLRAYVDREIARNADRESIYQMVEKDIARLYREEEQEHTGAPRVQTDAIYPNW